jgi:glycosyltransferase involved in cell wall biosynthesis
LPSKVIITSPSLDAKHNVSGISSVTQFIVKNNQHAEYIHFEIGKKDNEIRNLYWFIRIAQMYIRWARVLLNNRRALIHFNFAVDKFGLLRDIPLMLFAKALKRSMILHIHGGEYLLKDKVPKWITIALKLALRGINPIVVLSAQEAIVVKRKYKCKKVHVLPNCVDLTAAKSFERNIISKTPKILFLGRISKSKGLEYLYLALKNLKSKGYLFEFHLAGRGPDEQEYLQKFDDSLKESFFYNGIVSGDFKTDLLKACDIFILPSFFEGLPIALLESMSYGLVPIATPVGSIPDLITNGENGLIINIRSSKEIEDAIKQLGESTCYRKVLSQKAQEHIFLNYNPDSYVDTLNKIYLYE